MDGYRLGQLLNTIGNGIKNGIITDIEDSAEFVAFLFKAPVDIILKAIELLGKGEEMKAQALFDPEFFSNSREPNQEVLAFVEGIQGRPKPTGPTPDEIDAENEAKAAEVAVADRVSRPSVFSRRVDTTKSEEKTSQELQDEAYAQYKKDGKLDSYLDKIAEIESDK